MNKNLIYGLLLLSALSVSLNSCRTDEMMAGTEQTQKEKIAFFQRFEKEKSLSKNTESNNYALPFGNSMLAYFNNYPDKKVELENKYGAVDLRVSSQDIDLENGRKLLMFPMLTDGKVTAVIGGVINAERDYLYFDVYKEGHPDHDYLIQTFQQHYNSLSLGRTIDVGEVVIIVKKPELTKPDPWDEDPGGDGHDMGGGNGDFSDGGSGGNSGTPNANTNNPCEKMKAENQSQAFKNKVAEIDKKVIFDKDKETGFVAAYGPNTNYEPLANNNDNLKMPHGNKYFGFMHAHLDSKDGVVKIFSPADIFTFLTTCVRNAETKGSMLDAYGMVITSQGNYIVKYSGDGSFGIGPGTLSSWQSWYDDKFSELNETKGLTQENVEKLFTQFMDEKIKIDGLEVYKSDKSTGNTTKLKYDKNTKSVVQTPC